MSEQRVPRSPRRATQIEVMFALEPTAVYSSDGDGHFAVVASLYAANPVTGSPPGAPTPFQTLLTAIVRWLLDQTPHALTMSDRLAAVAAMLGTADQPPPGGWLTWHMTLDGFLRTITWKIRALDPTSPVPVDAVPLPMLDVLQLEYTGEHGNLRAIDFHVFNQVPFGAHRHRTDPDPAIRHSFAAHVAADYFLIQARHAIAALRREVGRRRQNVRAGGAEHELDAVLDDFDFASAEAVARRDLLGGRQFPIPDVPGQAAPLHVLTGQLYAVRPGATSISGTLSVSPTEGVRPGSVVFAGGTPEGVSCEIALPDRLPPMPAPEWQGATGPQLTPNNGTITVTSPPGVTADAVCFATNDPIAWNDVGHERTILQLPPQVVAMCQGDVRQLRVSGDTRSASVASAGAPLTQLPATPALLIRLWISRVPSSACADVPGGFLAHVYEISGISADTRDLVAAAVNSNLSSATISLLYATGRSSAETELVPSTALEGQELAPTAPIARTTLPPLNHTPAMRAPGLGTDAATTRDVTGFLRLLWEAAVDGVPGLHLFYSTASGDDLPAGLFVTPETPDRTEAIELDVVVQFRDAAATILPAGVMPNCLILDGRPTSTLYVEPLRNDGAPVLQYEPAHAAGSLGFSLAWQRPREADQPVPVRSPYSLIQYRVEEGGGYRQSAWSRPLWPSENARSRVASSGAEWLAFDGVVPVDTFYESPSANRYRAITRPVRLGFRLADPYGHALPERAVAQFLPLYHDPLLTIAQWPGVRWSWRAVRGSADAVEIVLSATFDPDGIVPPRTSGAGTASLEREWQAVLERYGLIVDQLTDPNTSVALTSTLTGGAVGGDFAQSLEALATAISASIQTALTGSVSSVQGFAKDITISIPYAQVAAATDDIFPVRVTVTIERNAALIDPVALLELPAARASSYTIPAAPPAAAGSTSDSDTQFARDFEAAFAGFDGSDGRLALARRAGAPKGRDATEGETYWAVRWSRRAGISVAFDAAPIFFARAPLCTVSLSGTFGGRTWTGVDIDEWARRFLAAYDSFVTPVLAVAIARLDAVGGTACYDEIARTRRRLASTLVTRVLPLLDGQPQGDPAAARARLEQALLSTLGTAYTLSTIAQVTATVTRNGGRSPLAVSAVQERLAGTVSPFAVAPAELPLTPGPGTMTVLLSAPNPSSQATLSLSLDYQVSHLQQDAGIVSAGSNGSSPWSSLRFLNPAGSPPQMPIGAEVTLPVPLVALPQPPSLLDQRATASTDDSGGGAGDIASAIAGALRWTYEARIAPNWTAQDTMFLDVACNRRLMALTKVEHAGAQDALAGLADALATFLRWHDESAGTFDGIARAALSPTAGPAAAPFAQAASLVSAFADLSSRVATAWEALRGRAQPLDVGPSNRIDPSTVAGNPTDPPGDISLGFTKTTTGGPVVEVRMRNLLIPARHSGHLSAWLVRNADLVPAAATNPAFVYTTSVRSFSGPVIPLIQRAGLKPLEPASSLTGTVETILQAVANAGAGFATTLRISVSYSARMPGVGPLPVRCEETVLLADHITLGDHDAGAAAIAAALAKQISAWHQAAARSTDGALLRVALTLFGAVLEQELPLVQLEEIPIDVSQLGPAAATWWTT